MAAQTTYSKNKDYLQLMYDSAKAGNLTQGKKYETQRNAKIDAEGSSYAKTNFFASTSQSDIVKAIENYKSGKSTATTTTTTTSTQKSYYTTSDVTMLAKLLYAECRGIPSDMEKACVVWTVLNRVDSSDFPNTISGVITQKNQFAYYSSSPVWTNLYNLAKDVLDRWSKEKSGQTNVGRVLPKEYKWYSGDGKHNYFRTKYQGGTKWNYSLANPYSS